MANVLFRIPKSLKEELLKMSLEAASVLGNLMQDFNQKRKLEVKPFLNKDFVGICNEGNSSAEWLFGDNISEQLKNSKATANVVRSTLKSQGRGAVRFNPYQRQNQNNFRGNLNWRAPWGRGAYNRSFRGSQFRRGSQTFRQNSQPYYQQNNQQK